MAAHITVKRPKKSLAAFRKKHEEKLLAMSQAELGAEMDATLTRLGKIIKKRS